MGGVMFLSCLLFGIGYPMVELAGRWVELGLGLEMEISGRFSPFDITWSWEVSCRPVSWAWLSYLSGTALTPGWSTKSRSSTRLLCNTAPPIREEDFPRVLLQPLLPPPSQDWLGTSAPCSPRRVGKGSRLLRLNHVWLPRGLGGRCDGPSRSVLCQEVEAAFPSPHRSLPGSAELRGPGTAPYYCLL